MNLSPLPASLIVVLICIIFALLGTKATGTALVSWYPTLRQPRFALSLGGWVMVGGLYYLLCAIIGYRLLVHQGTQASYWCALALWLVVLMLNEGWNYLFFGRRNLSASYIGMLLFAGVVLLFAVLLVMVDPISTLVLLPYVLWLGYDVIWAWSLWRLNQDANGSVK